MVTIRRSGSIFAANFVIATAITAGPGLYNAYQTWATAGEYGHGFFMAPIAAYLLLTRQAHLRAAYRGPDLLGIIMVAGAIMAILLGRISGIFFLQQAGFVAALGAAMAAVGGAGWARLAFMPALVLMFAVPLPSELNAKLSWQLQILSSDLGAGITRALGIPVFLEGNIIDFGLHRIEVVEACNGLRFLYPIISLTTLGAYLYRGPLWHKMLLIVSAVPITVLTNALRIALVGISIDRFGSAAADEVLHSFEGFAVFFVCLLILLAIMILLWRLAGGKRRGTILGLMALDRQTPPPAPAPHRLRSAPLIAISTMAGVSLIVAIAVVPTGSRYPDRPDFQGFPLTINDWQGRNRPYSLAVEQVLGADDYLSVNYRDRQGRLIGLFSAYYGARDRGTAPHSPEICLPVGGWTITSLRHIMINPDDGLQSGPAVPVVRAEISRANQRQLVYYWLNHRGRTLTNPYLSFVYVMIDSVRYNRSDSALIRFTTPIYADEDVRAAEARLNRFLGPAIARLDRHLPGLDG